MLGYRNRRPIRSDSLGQPLLGRNRLPGVESGKRYSGVESTPRHTYPRTAS
jgi:hypothetical protein